MAKLAPPAKKPWHLNPVNYTVSQFTALPYPTRSWAGKTVIVTGSNTGMGLEAARHFSRLGADRVVLAVRSMARGLAARESIVESTGRSAESVSVWELDLASHASIQAFAARANVEFAESGLDVLICNAGVYLYEFATADGGDETTIAINVVGTMLLSLLILPLLRETSVRKNGAETVLTITASFTHHLTGFPERKAKNIFEELMSKERARMGDRYNVSKLLQILIVRELAIRVSASSQPGNVTVSCINPGAVETEIMRNNHSIIFRAYYRLLVMMGLMRTPEVGGRTLVSAAEGGKETHGQYLADCTIALPSRWVVSEEGGLVQKKIWDELGVRLEAIVPRITGTI